MKVLAFTVLHYGKEYLRESILSVKDNVDTHLIAYTKTPSFGYGTDMQNPDTEEELKNICSEFDHIWWEDVTGHRQENQHRQVAVNFARKHGYDIILVIDSDEIWDPSKVQEAIDHAANSRNGQFLVKGSQWVTLWQSFNEYVTDGFAPVRLFNLHNDLMKAEYIDKGFIYHMGYCISDELMAYKISCHGHRADFDSNNKWHNEKWINYKKGETKFLHPATEAYWQETQPFDKTKLPEVLKKHPKYKK